MPFIPPMLASLGEASLRDPRLAYEPKYDGIRALVEVERGAGTGRVRIWSRLGNDKTGQFPDLVHTFAPFAAKVKASVHLDGEIVAVDPDGRPLGFQALQGRIHLRRADQAARLPPVAFIAFDVLRDGAQDLRRLPLATRRARLERIFGNPGSSLLRLSEFVAGDGTRIAQEAQEQSGEGLIAKQLDAPYLSGRRTGAWLKLKLRRRQEFVVGGYTEPRGSRSHLGALLLGVYEDGGLAYVGHTGTGFDDKELARLMALLRPRETAVCPFRTRPRTNERPHWVRPELVAEVKFTEWTADGILRHPIYAGLRDDVVPTQIRREPARVLAAPAAAAIAPPATRRSSSPAAALPLSAPLARVLAQIDDLDARGAGGTLVLPGGRRLEVSNLHKVLWPGPRITKGELLQYYTRVSSFILPAVADRPLVMKRFPNGLRAPAFYQQRAPAEVPPGVRVEVLPTDRAVPSRLVGGSLVTLLYMTQLAVISQDPWFSRVPSLDHPDHVALDLDPMPGVSFATVLDVARFIHDELERLGVTGVPKTSGAEGLHIYVPLRRGTSWEAGRLFCELVATIVAQKHPQLATVERAVHARGRTVYIDYLQNIRGKTLATAYSARASEWAGVSTPLTWQEVHAGVDREAFTLRTILSRLADVGDLWSTLRTSPGVDLAAIVEAAGRETAPPRRRVTPPARARRSSRRRD